VYTLPQYFEEIVNVVKLPITQEIIEFYKQFSLYVLFQNNAVDETVLRNVTPVLAYVFQYGNTREDTMQRRFAGETVEDIHEVVDQIAFEGGASQTLNLDDDVPLASGANINWDFDDLPVEPDLTDLDAVDISVNTDDIEIPLATPGNIDWDVSVDENSPPADDWGISLEDVGLENNPAPPVTSQTISVSSESILSSSVTRNLFLDDLYEV
jgi:hypothetical protein